MLINETQWIFLVFFAIFWGLVANVLPRWKPFQFTLMFRVRPQVWHRVLLPLAILNVVPIAYFALVFKWLGDYRVDAWTPRSVIAATIHGVLPAFAIFGIYRLWLGLLELSPGTYYRERPADIDLQFRANETTIEQLWYPKNGENPAVSPPQVEIVTGSSNLRYGGAYVVIALAVAWIDFPFVQALIAAQPSQKLTVQPAGPSVPPAPGAVP